MREDDAIFLNETFGPLVGVTTYRDLDEAIRLANVPGYGLSSSIYTTDANDAFRFRRGISAGMVSINNSTSGAEAHLPFGGNGKSGNGSRQSGVWVLDQFTRWQSMNWDYSGPAAEGADGCRRPHPRRVVPARRLTRRGGRGHERPHPPRRRSTSTSVERRALGLAALAPGAPRRPGRAGRSRTAG